MEGKAHDDDGQSWVFEGGRKNGQLFSDALPSFLSTLQPPICTGTNIDAVRSNIVVNYHLTMSR